MAGILHKVLRKPPYQRTIACFGNLNPLNLANPPPLPHPSHLTETILGAEFSLNLGSCSSTEEKISKSNAFHVHPSFSFAYFLNPVSPSGFKQSCSVDADGAKSDEPPMVWADSVKKKRKKKMNKHKLKKLRKRIRGHS